MKKLALLLFYPLSCFLFAIAANAQSTNLLFDDSDIIVRAETPDITPSASESDKLSAAASAKALLKQAPRKITPQNMPEFKSSRKKSHKESKPTFPAPFGLLWNASVDTTRNQGIQLTAIDLKDYPESYSASQLPKKLDFFDKVYITFGHTDELYRIIAYSHNFADNAAADKTIDYYRTYSEYLDKKYGNMEQNYTPAILTKTVKDSQGKDQEIKEEAPLGNPDFLEQLMTGEAVLYSTYHNNDVEATLSINVDGDKKSSIVIEYRNLQIMKQQENSTIDAL